MSTFLYIAIALFLIWLGFFFFSKSTRTEQLVMSVVGLVLAPAMLMVSSVDYRAVMPSETGGVGIEDFIFAFALFGIAAVIYQALFGKHTKKFQGERYKVKHPALHWFSHLLLILGIWIFAALCLVAVFSLASIQAFIVGGLFVGIYIVADRHDLLLDALLSGIMVAILVFIVEQIFFFRLFPETFTSLCLLSNTSAYVIGSVPMEEILWAAVIGFTIGPLYEYLRRYRLD